MIEFFTIIIYARSNKSVGEIPPPGFVGIEYLLRHVGSYIDWSSELSIPVKFEM